jgi:hypothetical protein
MPFKVDMIPGPLPTHCYECTPPHIMIKIAPWDDPQGFVTLGFKQHSHYKHVYALRSETDAESYLMCEKLRDLDIPFGTHRHMGADYQIEIFRSRGHVSGKFKRLSRLGYDWQDDVPYQIEEF